MRVTPPPAANGILTPRATLLTSARWDIGVIRVAFLPGHGSPALRDRIKGYAQLWHGADNVGVEFRFQEQIDDTVHVRVALGGTGDWSELGRHARNNRNLALPTMNLKLTERTTAKKVMRSVLHEFGHALGLVHEHQIPGEPIQWDREAVIADLRAAGWSVSEIEAQVLAPYTADESNTGTFDPNSIMLYPIKRSWTLNGFHVDWNRTLSDQDKARIAELY